MDNVEQKGEKLAGYPFSEVIALPGSVNLSQGDRGIH